MEHAKILDDLVDHVIICGPLPRIAGIVVHLRRKFNVEFYGKRTIVAMSDRFPRDNEEVRRKIMCDTASYCTRYIPFIHLHCRICTYVHPLYMYITPYIRL